MPSLLYTLQYVIAMILTENEFWSLSGNVLMSFGRVIIGEFQHTALCFSE